MFKPFRWLCWSCIVALLITSLQSPSIWRFGTSTLLNVKIDHNPNVDNDSNTKRGRSNFSQEIQVGDWDGLLSSMFNVTITNSSRQCEAKNKYSCQCNTLAAERKDHGRWERHHRHLVQTAETLRTRNLDVMFLGDSIIEQWNGTRQLSKGTLLENRESFERKFSKSHGAQLEGLPMGAAGDTIQNLRWHVLNGYFPETINPKVVWILIGTNNLDVPCLSMANISVGILDVAHLVHNLRPNATIVVQGLLPLGDELGNFTLRGFWRKAQGINSLLKSMIQNISFLHYYEATTEELLVSEREISEQHSRDGVHPSNVGYDVIGKGVETEILQLLS